jgi:hypothetical protein
MTLHGHGLAAVVVECVRRFVEGEIFAEALEDIALLIFDEGNDGDVDGG